MSDDAQSSRIQESRVVRLPSLYLVRGAQYRVDPPGCGLTKPAPIPRSLSHAAPVEQWGAGLGEFLDGIDELVAILFIKGDRQGEHAAFGEPDAARDEIKPEEVAQRSVALLGILGRADRPFGHMDRQHRAEPGELHRKPAPARHCIEALAQ